jgi:ribosomal protein S3AE
MANVKTKTKKGAKKSFYEVKAPLTAAKIHLYATSPGDLKDKRIKIDLTKNLRGKSLELKLKIKLSGDDLIADAESTELLNSYIRRAIRKGTDYCEDSFEAKCRDNVVRIKPLLISRRRVSRAVLKALRESARRHLEAYVKTRDAQELFAEIISNKLQKNLSLKLKKIYPLALCEIRVFKIVKALEKKREE